MFVEFHLGHVKNPEHDEACDDELYDEDEPGCFGGAGVHYHVGHWFEGGTDVAEDYLGGQQADDWADEVCEEVNVSDGECKVG